MLQETARRVSDAAIYAPPLVIANNDHRFIVAEQLQQAASGAEVLRLIAVKESVV